MDIYHVYCNLKPGVRDVEFCNGVDQYLGHLRERGLIEGHRITRAKLGFKPPHLTEFHIMIEVRDLAQLEAAFERVSERTGKVEELHFGVNSKVTDVFFALYRDFPDPQRQTGQERF